MYVFHILEYPGRMSAAPLKAQDTHLLSVECVQPFHSSRVELNGLGNVGQHLLKRVSRLFIQQHPDGLAWLDSTPDHGHKLGFDEIFTLLAIPRCPLDPAGNLSSRSCACSCQPRAPVRVDVLGVVYFPVGFVRCADVALACKSNSKVFKMKALYE